MAKRQTRRSQKPLSERAYWFESSLRHRVNWFDFESRFAVIGLGEIAWQLEKKDVHRVINWLMLVLFITVHNAITSVVPLAFGDSIKPPTKMERKWAELVVRIVNRQM